MAEKKNFLNWVGFTEEESSNLPSSVDRIRELEAQIADLKSRRDITGLTKEEFNTHKFTFTYKKDYINTFCFKLGDIELRKFYFERYHHISHGIWNYFESQFAKKPATNTKIKSIDEKIINTYKTSTLLEQTLPEDYKKSRVIKIDPKDEEILNKLNKILEKFSENEYTKDNL